MSTPRQRRGRPRRDRIPDSDDEVADANYGRPPEAPDTLGGGFLLSLQSIFGEVSLKSDLAGDKPSVRKQNFNHIKLSIVRHLRLVKRNGVTRAGAEDPIKLPDGTQPQVQVIRPPACLRERLTDKFFTRLSNAKDGQKFITLIECLLNPRKRTRQKKQKKWTPSYAAPTPAQTDAHTTAQPEQVPKNNEGEHVDSSGEKQQQNLIEVDGQQKIGAEIATCQTVQEETMTNDVIEAANAEAQLIAEMMRTPYCEVEEEEANEEYDSEDSSVDGEEPLSSVEDNAENLPTVSVEDSQRIDLLFATFSSLQKEISFIDPHKWELYQRKLVNFLVSPSFKKMDFSARLFRIKRILYLPEELEATCRKNWDKLRALAKICAKVSERMGKLHGSPLGGLADEWLGGMNRDIDFFERM